MDFYVDSRRDTRRRRSTDIKRAYRRLARRFHPDINPGDAWPRAAVQGDRAGLRDAERSGQPAEVRPRGYQRVEVPDDAGRRVRGLRFLRQRAREAATTFGDLFADVFRRERAPGGRRRGAAPICMPTMSCPSKKRCGAANVRSSVTRQARCATCAGQARSRRGVAVRAVSGQRGSCDRRGGTWCFRDVSDAAAAAGVERWQRCGACAAPG